jgi:hypothetical protein
LIYEDQHTLSRVIDVISLQPSIEPFRRPRSHRATHLSCSPSDSGAGSFPPLAQRTSAQNQVRQFAGAVVSPQTGRSHDEVQGRRSSGNPEVRGALGKSGSFKHSVPSRSQERLTLGRSPRSPLLPLALLPSASARLGTARPRTCTCRAYRA